MRNRLVWYVCVLLLCVNVRQLDCVVDSTVLYDDAMSAVSRPLLRLQQVQQNEARET